MQRPRNFKENLRNTPFPLGSGREEGNAEGCWKFSVEITACNPDGTERYLPNIACAKFATEK